MKILIGIPTLNEELNVFKIYTKIRNIFENVNILFLDDNSSDGTISEIEKLKSVDKKVILNIRKTKIGIGSAHKDIIKYAYKNNYNYLITLDADGTHNPKYIKKMLHELRNKNDLIITNRFYFKDSLKTWSIVRIAITKIRHFLVNTLLGISFDTSGAFRIYNLNKIKLNDILKAKHNGYSFFWESIFILSIHKYKITEIPIKMEPRTYGSSKISFKEIISAIFYLNYIFFKRLFRLSF